MTYNFFMKFLKSYFNKCALIYDYYWHNIDVHITQLKLSSAKTDAHKKTIESNYKERLIKRYLRSLDAGSESTAKAQGIASDIVINRRRKSMENLIQDIRTAPAFS